MPGRLCSRTVDGHYELDAREYMSQSARPIPFELHGTVDGKVMDSDMAGGVHHWRGGTLLDQEYLPLFRGKYHRAR